ncbi:MAG: alginate lyase family protein [Bryobacterales bacterium]|nr:alginate lyase family protein [Bryobacterales bacterium]
MLTTCTPPVWFPIVDEEQAGADLIAGILNGRFTFNHETHTLHPGFDWTANPSSDIEWQILLHKFYYAPALVRAWRNTGEARYLHQWMTLTDAWIAQVPVDFLPADVAGRRLQNWVSAWHYVADAAELPAGFRARFTASVAAQAEWLSRNLTPARNHRTLELLALFMVSVAFADLSGAPRWAALARVAITENLQSDFRPDGVHCEQSTGYHHIVLRNAIAFARLAAMNAVEMPAEFHAAIRRALDFALYIHRPDGLIPSLSDGDNGSYLALLETGYELFGDENYRWVATRGQAGRAPQARLKAFPDGGYYILRSGWGERERYDAERYLVFDCGPLGEGNHGHFDLLSFEWYGDGRALVVDPGRYTYDESGGANWRVAFRSTAAHNTVTVDGRNQTRYEFHKRKFKVRGPEPGYQLLGFGSRDGYDFVRGRAESFEYDVVHEREIRFSRGGTYLVVLDELDSTSPHVYEQTFQLAPGAQRYLTVTQRAPGAWCTISAGWVSPEYGVKQPAPVIKYRLNGTSVRFETHLELHR